MDPYMDQVLDGKTVYGRDLVAAFSSYKEAVNNPDSLQYYARVV
jgi:hypothetical protein